MRFSVILGRFLNTVVKMFILRNMPHRMPKMNFEQKVPRHLIENLRILEKFAFDCGKIENGWKTATSYKQKSLRK